MYLNLCYQALIKKQSDAKVEGLKEKMKRLAEERDAAITEVFNICRPF